ncbi:MAG: hypothetical protein V3S69_06560 [Dehalococcoidales bacterium]
MTLQRTSPTQQQVASLLPEFEQENETKQLFLSFRICGFSEQESLTYSNVPLGKLAGWLDKDAIFERLTTTDLQRLQDEAIDEILEREKTKNYRRSLAIDSQVLNAAMVGGVDDLPEQSFEYLKTIKGKYDKKVIDVLGLQPGDRMPMTMDELTVTYRRMVDAKDGAEEGNKRNKTRKVSARKDRIIEAEHSEGSVK